jgi:hypothetical protein
MNSQFYYWLIVPRTVVPPPINFPVIETEDGLFIVETEDGKEIETE